MKLAIFMDPLISLNVLRDTSIAILAEAHKRGWSCVYFTEHDLFAEEGAVWAHVTPIEVNSTGSDWCLGSKTIQLLSQYDIILIRKDPPFNLAYLYATQLLSLVEKQGVLVTNKPQSLRDYNEKLSILQYSNCCVPTMVSANTADLKQFWKQHRSVIFKPLDAMGGHNICHISEDGRNLAVILQWLTEEQTVPIMAQKFISDIAEKGDKRIIVINGAPVPFGLARFPAPGESRANLVAGGQGFVVPITEHDRLLCERISGSLQAQELYFVGLDVIGDYITEINVTSPTCIRQISLETGLDIAGDYLNFLTERLKT